MRKKTPVESEALKDARRRFREMEGHAARWTEHGAPLYAMAGAIAALSSIAGEIAKLEGKTQ